MKKFLSVFCLMIVVGFSGNVFSQVLVVKVGDASNAAKAGLEVGDIFISYGGTKIKKIDDLISLIKSSETDKKVTINRNGSHKTFTVKAGSLGVRIADESTFAYCESYKQYKNNTGLTVKGLYIGMHLCDAESIINSKIKKDLFVSHYIGPITWTNKPGSKQYNDAEKLRKKNLRFKRQNNGSYKFGGMYISPLELPVPEKNIYGILYKDSPKYRKVFDSGIEINTNTEKKIIKIVYAPEFVKSSFGVGKISIENFAKKFSSSYKIGSMRGIKDRNSKKIKKYIYESDKGYKVVISEHLRITISKASSSSQMMFD